MCNTQNIIRLYKFIKPLIKCVQSYPKDFRLLNGSCLVKQSCESVDEIRSPQEACRSYRRRLFQVFVYGIAANACGEETEGSYVSMVGIE